MAFSEDRLIPELQTYCDAFSMLKREANELTNGLSDSQFVWKPSGNRWSVAECLSHLNTAGHKLLPGLERAIEKGRENGTLGSSPNRYGLVSRLFIRTLAPSARLKMKTFKIYLPAPNETLEKAEVLSEFEGLQDTLSLLAQKANGLDLKRIKVPSPEFAWLRPSLGAWFAATIGHEKRHLAQAERVMNEPTFPCPA